jgi:hypothetical protein
MNSVEKWGSWAEKMAAKKAVKTVEKTAAYLAAKKVFD